MGYYPVGPYIPNNYGFDIQFPDSDNSGSSARPYVESDKSARTTAIFQGISGLVNSAGDFYQRIKYAPSPVAGRGGDPNIYWGGGISYKPGDSGEPTKLGFTGQGGLSPLMILLIVGIILFFFLKK